MDFGLRNVIIVGLVVGLFAFPGQLQAMEPLVSPVPVSSLGDTPDQQVFETIPASKLRASLKVIASRNYAYYGFNTPEIQIHLPLLGNSSYANLEMPQPTLKDAKKKDVAYTFERGLHDLETQIKEIRFLAQDAKSPAEFARAVGVIEGTYPLKIEKIAVKAGQKSDSVRIEGQSVAVKPGVLPELPPFLEVHPVRAFDRSGAPLKVTGRPSPFSSDENAWPTYEFEGKVARAEVHTVAESALVHIRYDVPIAPPLPPQRRGSATKDPRAVKVDADSRIEIKVDLVEKTKPKPTAKPEASTPPASADRPKGNTKITGKSVPLAPPQSLTESAKTLAKALDDLQKAVPENPAVVQMMYQVPTMVTFSVETGKGVREWTWVGGKVSGPNPVDTQWLQCKKGMPAKALTLARLPSVLDDATKRVGNGKPLQLVVGQGPCGTASVYIAFDNRRSVQYEGDGILKTVQ